MKRILIIDDHAVVRDGLKRMWEENQTATISFGEASTGPEAVHLAEQQQWDVAVLDLSLGGTSGLEVLKQLRQIRPKLPVLILSMHSEEQYARRAFQAGAAGYITKDSTRAELVNAITKVKNGGRYVSPHLAEKLLAYLGKNTKDPPHECLSDREFEVMCLIASGKTLSEIAELLSLSDKTISTYRARILEKMAMKTNAELTYYAIHNKLVV